MVIRDVMMVAESELVLLPWVNFVGRPHGSRHSPWPLSEAQLLRD